MPIDQLPQAPPAHIARAPSAAEAAIGKTLRAAGFRAIRLRASSVGHFHLSGTIDGRPVEVLLDTGASNTVVDRGWATAAGYTLAPIAGTGGGIGAVGLDLATIPGAVLRLGRVALGDVRLLAIDLSGIQAQLKANQVTVPQVVLGADTLRARRAVIDYATATLWLAPARRKR